MKKEGREGTYSVWSNYRYAFRHLREREGGGTIAVSAARTATGILLPFLETALAGAVAACLVSGREPEVILLLIAGYVVLLQGVRFLHGCLDELQGKNLMLFRIGMQTEFYRKCVEIDGQYLESAQGQEKLVQAQENLFSGEGSGIEGYLLCFWHALYNCIGMLVYGIIVGRASLFLLVLLVLQTLVIERVQRHVWRKAYTLIRKNAKNRQDFFYLRRESIVSGNGKDIRLYRMDKWLLGAFHKVVDRIVALEYRTARGPMLCGMLEILLTFLRNAVVYVYLIAQMARGSMELPAFLLYVGMVAGFGTWVNGLFGALERINRTRGMMDRYRDFMDSGVAQAGGEPVRNPGRPHEIRLENVCFRYEGSEKDTIHNLSVTIRPGEKLALVGLNGAGKTTLVKLLCGLYRPTSGRILLDGQDVQSLSQKAYFKEFAVVFQEVFAFSFPLVENVSCAREGTEDARRVEESLDKAGLLERAQKLPRGYSTVMNKDLDEEGVALSGGQMQKLMLARALYRDAPIVILDEPTAALDPIAESEMYEKYHEMLQDKTGIFISHRLSSSQFCDRILYMEDGRVAEDGSQEELMARQGAYAKLYALQAQYYQEKRKEGEGHA